MAKNIISMRFPGGMVKRFGKEFKIRQIPCYNGREMEQRSPKVQKKCTKTIVLVGLMGAGKSTIGRRMASKLNMSFIDADEEIEKAAGLSISEIFEEHGEHEFRRGERQVIARLLKDPPHVLATGGGAFMDRETRQLIKSTCISIWLRASLETLVKRVRKRNHRPLLQQKDPANVLQSLIDERYPVYAEAHITVDSADGPQRDTVSAVMDSLSAYCSEHGLNYG